MWRIRGFCQLLGCLFAWGSFPHPTPCRAEPNSPTTVPQPVGRPDDLTLAGMDYVALGDPAATFGGVSVRANGPGVSADDATAVQSMRIAADAGDTTAMVWLAWFYHQGRGVAADATITARLNRKAADAGNPCAMSNLGWLYEKGDGVPRDYAEALHWYRKAADLGNGLAMNGIGWAYLNGAGVPRDYTQAMIWLRKSADAGTGRGMNNVGWIYQNGWGVEKDYDMHRGEQRRRTSPRPCSGLARRPSTATSLRWDASLTSTVKEKMSLATLNKP